MFNNSVSVSGVSGNGSIIKSGYDVKAGMSGFGRLKESFVDCLNISPEEVNEEAVEKYAKLEGQHRGFNALFKRLSRQKLNAARAINQTYSGVWQHAQGAAQQELQWQTTTSRNLQQMSEKMIDMNIAEKSHDGFSEYLNTADRLITY